MLFFLLLKRNEICPDPCPSIQFEDFISFSKDFLSLLKAPKLLIINRSFGYLHLIISLPLILGEPNKIVQIMKSPDS